MILFCLMLLILSVIQQKGLVEAKYSFGSPVRLSPKIS